MRRCSGGGTGRGRNTLAVLASLFLLGADGPEIPFVRAPADALPTDAARWERHAARWERQPFDAVATDADLDGDTDVLINWHHTDPLELLENRNGRFERLSPARSGLTANRGWGCAHSSRAGQALQPLRFGVLPGAPRVRVEVLWPGEVAAQLYPAPPLRQRTELHRASAP